MDENGDIVVYLLRRDDINGSGGYHEIAYLSSEVSKYYASELEDDWTSYVPERKKAERISGDRCIVDRTVYNLNEEMYIELVRKRALEKLSPHEQHVLGLDRNLGELK